MANRAAVNSGAGKGVNKGKIKTPLKSAQLTALADVSLSCVVCTVRCDKRIQLDSTAGLMS